MKGAGVLGDSYNYRETVSVWFRSIFLLQPQGELMADTPLAFRIHALGGMALFLIWPFTRLVHAFSAPLGYMFRPYVVYRTRSTATIGSRATRRGWDRTEV
jgi:respiratory nitrate reductase gamma subunit